MVMRAAELLEGEALAADAAATSISALAYDSRRVTPGALFAAWAGARADGHAHVPEALDRGAAFILCEHPVDSRGKPQHVTPQVRRTLAAAAARFYGDPAASLRMVGVTGTNGKTTTTSLIEALFEAAGLRPGVIGTLGTRYGGQSHDTGFTTPESVDLMASLACMRNAGVLGVAMEVSSQALAQSRVAGVRYDVGVFTNLTQDHLDYHGTLDAYFAAKAQLFRDHLKPGGVAVLNLDDPRVATLAGPKSLGFSRQGAAAAALCVRSCRMTAEGIALDLQTPAGPFTVASPLLGGFNVENILAAVGAGLALGLPPAVISRGIAALTRVPGRLERVSRPGEPLVLVDYAHTPDALDKALAAVREVTRGRLFCVFGCGGDRDPRSAPPWGRRPRAAPTGPCSPTTIHAARPRRLSP